MFYLMHRNQHRESSKMKKQRNIFQMKEQDKILGKYLNEMEVSILPDEGLKVIVILLFTKLGEVWMNTGSTSTKR